MSDAEHNYYHMTIAGCERDLPICAIDEHLDIAGFVMLGDVELTEKAAAALLKNARSTMWWLQRRRKVFRCAMKWPGKAAGATWLPGRA